MRSHVVALSLVAASAPLAHADAEPPPYESLVVQAGGGVITPGSINVGGHDDSTAAGPYVTIAVDKSVSRGASIGAYLVSADLDEIAVKAVGASLKARIDVGHGAQLRLGVGVGYQKSNVYYASYTATPVSGLGLTPFAELAFAPTNKLGLALQVSAVSQPFGGGEGMDVTWAPIPTIALLGELRSIAR